MSDEDTPFLEGRENSTAHRALESSNRNPGAPRALESSNRNLSAPRDLESSNRNPAAPRALESSNRNPAAPRALESSNRDPAAPRALESSNRNPGAPRTLESSNRNPAAPRALESGNRNPGAPRTLESSNRNLGAPRALESSNRNPGAPRALESSNRNPAAPRALESSNRNPAAPRLGLARPSENVPPEISVYDCNSEEDEEAMPAPPPRKRAALSPLKPLNPMVTVAPGTSQASKPRPKGQVSGPSGSAVRQDSQLGSKDSREPSHSEAIYYVYSQRLVELCDQIPKIPKRASIVHSLVEAFGLTTHATLLDPDPASKEELQAFHCQEYLDFLERLNLEEDAEKHDELKMQFGLGYDCPSMPLVYDFVRLVAGASLCCAKALVQNKCRIAINWNGGWHHARRDEAAGFCYVNDIVLAILKLREHFDRVLYVDLDLHHGDAVDDAFIFTPKVMTVSLHKHCPGFFPGTGSVDRVGAGRGRFYTVSVPIKDGIRDEQYTDVFTRVLQQVRCRYNPSVLVVQCGADTLSSDPMQSFNLTPQGVGQCLSLLLSWNLPTMLLGGGGYHLANTARCWATLTGLVTGQKLPSEIPDHEYFLEYGPGYQLEVSPAHYTNHNSAEYLDGLVTTITENLQNVR